ncbi:MAG: 50S ribosomal protein L25/general stress protein Ctc [Crocinitomicaceae bacterium]|nr:50S ribosomal protein L25/general stress protein Ctc [Crocinitomicaceae bacterium]|tara:strand:+ start:189 stop:791 length:603 start_codon:yes stop_codon:yes gene_type:complete
MKTTTISGTLRKSIGGKDAKGLRKEGLVPCVLYGGEENVHFAVDSRAFTSLIYTPDTYRVELDLEGKKYDSVFQAQQFDPVTDEIVHADFLEVSDEKVISTTLPVKLTGNAIGVRNGGKLRTPVRKLKIKGPVSAIPDDVEIDVTRLRIGRSVKVADINLEGVQILDSPNNVIVAVKMARGAVDAGDEEEEEATEEAAAE